MKKDSGRGSGDKSQIVCWYCERKKGTIKKSAGRGSLTRRRKETGTAMTKTRAKAMATTRTRANGKTKLKAKAAVARQRARTRSSKRALWLRVKRRRSLKVRR